MTPVASLLETLQACTDCIPWAGGYSEYQEAWDACPRGNWMAWYLGKLAESTEDGSPEHRRAVLVTCLCVRAFPTLSEESLQSLGLIEEWAWGGESFRREAQKLACSSLDMAVDDETHRAAAAAFEVSSVARFHHTAAMSAHDALVYLRYSDGWEADPAALADLIRAAVPVIPLPKNLGSSERISPVS